MLEISSVKIECNTELLTFSDRRNQLFDLMFFLMKRFDDILAIAIQ